MKKPVEESGCYVSRAADKLVSVTSELGLDFGGMVVLDVGSSTGGFTQYALENGAAKVIAVEKGKLQLSPILRSDQRIELHEKTDIRDFKLEEKVDIVLVDVSFVSLTEILPAVARLAGKDSIMLVMAKPQFETRDQSQKHRGVIKNERMRRNILKQLEGWIKQRFIILGKADSQLTGIKGNRERFYKLKLLSR